MYANTYRNVVQVSLIALIGIVLFTGCGTKTVQKVTKAATATAIIPTATPRPTWQLITKSDLAKNVDQYISNMSLDDRIGQLIIAQFSSLTYAGDSQNVITKIHPAGVIMYAWEMNSLDQTKGIDVAAQKDSPIPLLINSDVEGGPIDNLKNIFKAGRPGAPQITANGDTQYAYAQGKKTAQDLLSIGMNMNLAPVVDVQTLNGPDQNGRDFGTVPQPVITYGGAYLDGLQQNGVVGTMKHFPGLGGASIDAHLGLPVINRTRDQIESVDLAPYRALINSANPPGVIMSTDLLMPAIDPKLPAELSPAIITGVLRNELHFDGVVMTDALYMKGITDTYSMYQAGVLSIVAGCDLLLGPSSYESSQLMVTAIKDALNNGTLTEARINESVHRVLMLKAQMGWWSPTATPTVAP